jgi:hypothetical protein
MRARHSCPILVALLLALGPVACGSETTADPDTGGSGGFVATGGVGGAGGAGGAIDIAQLLAAVETELCPTWVACDGYLDLASCVASNAWVTPTIAAAISRGTIVYDAGAAAECVHARAMNGCRLEERPLESCDRMFTGRVATGGACVLDEECLDGGGCVFHASEARGACNVGTCQGGSHGVIVPPGGDCSDTAECARGTFCDNSSKCAPLRSTGSICNWTGQCELAAVCVGSQGPNQPGRCRVPRAKGESCDPTTAPCGDMGTYCDPVSLRCVGSKKPGESCDNALCAVYAFCAPVGGSTGGASGGGNVGTAGSGGSSGDTRGSGTGGVLGGGSVCQAIHRPRCQDDSDCGEGLVCAAGGCTEPPCLPEDFPPRTISSDKCGLLPPARDLPRADPDWDVLCTGHADCWVTSGEPEERGCPNTCSCACYGGVCYENTCTDMPCFTTPVFH